MNKPKYGLLLTPAEAMAYDKQRDAARAMLAALEEALECPQAQPWLGGYHTKRGGVARDHMLAAIAAAKAAGIT